MKFAWENGKTPNLCGKTDKQRNTLLPHMNKLAMKQSLTPVHVQD